VSSGRKRKAERRMGHRRKKKKNPAIRPQKTQIARSVCRGKKEKEERTHKNCTPPPAIRRKRKEGEEKFDLTILAV